MPHASCRMPFITKAARTIMSEPLFGAYISFLKYGIFFMM